MAISVKFLLFICLFFSKGALMAERTDYTEEEYALMSRSVHEIVDAFEKEMGKQFGLLCTGQGGSMPYDIQEIGVSLVLYRQVEIEEARELEIRATDRFIEMINSHEAIRPYLRDYPWDHNRARIKISFRQNNGRYFRQGVTLILQAKEKIFYYGPKKFPNDIDHMKEESYAEAKNIVNSAPSCLKPVQKKKGWFNWL